MDQNRYARIADPDDDEFRSLVKKDLKLLMNKKTLSLKQEDYLPLIIDSVWGHATNGHAGFEGVIYPGATREDIALAADLRIDNIKGYRRRNIEDYREWLELVKKDATGCFEFKGRPLFGVKFLKKYPVTSPEAVLRATISNGLMDNYGWRKRTQEKYSGQEPNEREFKIGGGESYIFDYDKLIEWNFLAIDYLANNAISEEEIKELQELLADDNTKDPRSVYVRRKIGLGTSDDCSFIIAGVMNQEGGSEDSITAALSGFLIDAVDSYHQFVSEPKPNGDDEEIALELRKEYPDLVSDDEIMTLICLSAKTNGEKELISSSHRRLIEVVDRVDPKQTTMEHHLKFLETGKFPRFRIGFERMSSLDFYPEVQRRIELYKKLI